jgi:hypothetical protein
MVAPQTKGLERYLIGGQLVGQPGDALGRMVEYCRTDTGFLDDTVAVEHCRHFAQINRVWTHGAATQHHSGIRGIVGNGVEDFARNLGLRIDLLNARIDNFQCRAHPFGGVQYIEHCDIRAFQWFAEDKGQLHFDPWHDKA